MGGAYNPHPLQFGQEANKIIEELQNGLADAQGTALATERGTIAWAENHAMARIMAELVNAAQKLANQWDPQKMTDFIPRWEKILGLIPLPSDSMQERRRAISLKLSLSGEKPAFQALYDFLSELLGDFFVDIVHSSSDDATGSIPGGLSIPGGATLEDGPWRSSIAYLAIKTQKPEGVSDYEFYSTVNKIHNYLHYFLPAWATFDWFLPGPDGDGFFLDQDYNLDNQAFDS